MKRIIALLLAVMMVFALCACGQKNPTETTPAPEGTKEPENTAYDYDAIEDNMTSADGKYELAFVTDVGQLKDQSFNQGTWEGLKRYAHENEISYKYYQPANGNEATDTDRYDAMKAAVDAGAKVVVCAGFLQETALRKVALEFPDTKFVFIDGYPLTENKDDQAAPVLKNVAPVSFQEEQAGYLAGYAAVMEGFTKLGFSGGGGGENPACCKFGYGYVQGAEAAAKDKNVKVEMNYSWNFGATFSDSPDLQTMLNGWYTNGTEVIFCCGGSMCNSAFAAASENQGAVIGVDVDQSSKSDTVITSATKGLRESVMYVLEKFYADEWDAVGGVQTVLGAKDNAVGLPTDTWSLENFSKEDYEKLFASLADGTVTVDDDYATLSADSFENVTLNIVE